MGWCRTFRYALYPTARQERALLALLARQCELYNAALEERRGAWKWEKRSVSYIDQCRTLTGCREVRPELLANGVTVCRGTLKRLDRAYAGLFRRCKTGQKPGFPRFKPVHRWDSVQWEDRSGWSVRDKERRLRLFGIGDIKLRVHRPLNGTPKAITVAREGRKWWVSIRCVNVPAEPLPPTGRAIGIDVGVINQVATSDGQLVTAERYGKKAAARLAAAQRSLATKRRGSMRRRRAVARVAACHRRVRNQRSDFAHQLSRQLVNTYDVIVHEDLPIANLVRRPKPVPVDGVYAPNGAAAKAGLNRSIHDAGWGQLLRYITYKAESAGRELVAVPAPHTSQRCSRCGHTDPRNRPTQEAFRCCVCSYTNHADINAAVNILRLGKSQQPQTAKGRN